MSELVPSPGPLEQQRGTFDDESRATFVAALGAGWSVTKAAELAGVHRMTVYRHRADDAEFAKAWADAWQAGRDALVDEARRRAFEGVPEPVYQGGKLVGAVRRYSDRLLEFLLKQRDPSFRDGAQVSIEVGTQAPAESRNAAIDKANAALDEYLASPELRARFELRREAIEAMTRGGAPRPTSRIGDLFAFADELGVGAESLRLSAFRVAGDVVDGEAVDLDEFEAGEPAINDDEGTSDG